jgi:hypothetical protein
MLEKRYDDPRINRQYWLADALVHLRTYPWFLVDKAADGLTDADVEAFGYVVRVLNAQRE